MNYLAHIYLSGTSDGVIIGNFIADGIKGKKYKKYPQEIQKGILLHRRIDTFTDSHPIVRQSTKRLHKKYSHYSGVIVDILYDHFLAKNWQQYSEQPLAEYVADFYNLLVSNFEILPTRIQRMMPYMISNNWLLNYATISGISNVLEGMNVRTKNISKMNFAVIELEFFKELIDYSKQLRETL
jgi:acyl carrier protein phosphodiesterase